MPQRFKFWLLVALLCSNFAVGAIGLYSMRELDRNYAQLVERGLPTLNVLRALTREIGVVQRTSLRAAIAVTAEDRAEQLGRLSKARTEVAAQLNGMPVDPVFGSAEDRRELREVAARYEATVERFLTLLASGQEAEAVRIQREVMRPAYDDFIENLDEVAEHTLRAGSMLSRQYAEDTRSFTRLLVILSGWPIAIIGLGLVLALVLSLFLLLAYRSMGRPEQP
jgi:hypothetical protein